MNRSRPAVMLTVLLLIGALTACSDESFDNNDGSDESTSQRSLLVPKVTFAEPVVNGTQPLAVTYDTALVPTTGTATVRTQSNEDKTTVVLTVTGLAPTRDYGAHVHTKPCGAKPADSGPHYQNRKDPIVPSTDPEYANDRNEAWLDFTTDTQGAAKAEATVDWEFRPGEANAVVIHQTHTVTHHGKAGTAGDRAACITTEF